jgi:hypothetical protein
MSALKEATAKRLAKYFRLLASDHDGEVSAALQAAKRLLASEGLNFNDIGIVIENAVADGPLEIEPKKYTDTEANKIYEMGKQDGRAEEANNRPAVEPTEYYDAAGNPIWNAMALYCQSTSSSCRPGITSSSIRCRARRCIASRHRRRAITSSVFFGSWEVDDGHDQDDS